MTFLKWVIISVLVIQSVSDFVRMATSAVKADVRNDVVSGWISTFINGVLWTYVVYILITVWHP